MALKQVMRSALKPVSAAVDLVQRPPAGVTVLIYHRVGARTGGEVDLDTAMFDDQMAELAETSTVLSLTDAVDALASREQRQDSAVVVTFDDGTPDVVEHALPVLEKYRVPMTLYLATRSIDEGVGFWDPADRALTWDALRDAVSTGLVEVGSHTHRHALLDRIPVDEVADELDRSIGLIGDRLGVEARHFAYPKALAPSADADREVRARFASAAIAGTRVNPWDGTDVHLLARSPIQRSDGMRWFRRKATGGMGAEDRVREIVNRRRYAGATS